MTALTPIPTCAVDPSAQSCEHDRLEPNWSINPVEETGIPGPYVFCCIAMHQHEVAEMSDSALMCHLSDMEASIEAYTDPRYVQIAGAGEMNACEKQHLANYRFDFAKLTEVAVERGLRFERDERGLLVLA